MGIFLLVYKIKSYCCYKIVNECRKIDLQEIKSVESTDFKVAEIFESDVFESDTFLLPIL